MRDRVTINDPTDEGDAPKGSLAEARLRVLAAALGRQAARELFRAATSAPAVPPPQADVAAMEEGEHGPRRD